MKFLLPLLGLLTSSLLAAEPDFPLTPDSIAQPTVAKGTMIKDVYVAGEGSVFPGTEREYQLYLPAGLDKTQPVGFMVFQDGVIYQAPIVFDNLIAKKEIPPMIGIFIKPGVVPAANDNALPRYNRSYEYDSITTTYSDFLIDEFLPAIEKKHGVQLSTDPNQTAISGNSSGGICAFMVAWHRPDRFRRVFTGVGTYVGIHGADQLPVLVRKIEPKPLRVFLQSGTGDNNLYCGDWWMANQMMERSLSWAGYEVNHAWGEGGHNGKHATQIFPDVLRWLWKDWQTNIEIKANAKGESKWKGYEVVNEGDWNSFFKTPEKQSLGRHLIPFANGSIYLIAHGWRTNATDQPKANLLRLNEDGKESWFEVSGDDLIAISAASQDRLWMATVNGDQLVTIQMANAEGQRMGSPITVTKGTDNDAPRPHGMSCSYNGRLFFTDWSENMVFWINPDGTYSDQRDDFTSELGNSPYLCFSPDQTQLYIPNGYGEGTVAAFRVTKDGKVLNSGQSYHQLQDKDFGKRALCNGLCVDTEGRLYVATSLGIQVCDQAGRVNFIIPTPQVATDVCFAGKDLSDLMILSGDTIYKRSTKAHGVVSSQQAPIKPAAPKL